MLGLLVFWLWRRSPSSERSASALGSVPTSVCGSRVDAGGFLTQYKENAERVTCRPLNLNWWRWHSGTWPLEQRAESSWQVFDGVVSSPENLVETTDFLRLTFWGCFCLTWQPSTWWGKSTRMWRPHFVELWLALFQATNVERNCFSLSFKNIVETGEILFFNPFELFVHCDEEPELLLAPPNGAEIDRPLFFF